MDVRIGVEIITVDGCVNLTDSCTDFLCWIKSRENFYEDDLSFGATKTNVLQAQLDSVCNSAGRYSIRMNQRCVVHSDHEYDHFGRHTVERSVIESPKNIFDAITTNDIVARRITGTTCKIAVINI